MEKPRRGVAFVFLPYDDPSVRKSAKFGSRDKMYFRLFSQASIEVIVSFEESDHCFGALCEVITTVHEFWLDCSERRLKSKNSFDVLSVGSLKMLRCHHASELSRNSERENTFIHRRQDANTTQTKQAKVVTKAPS